MKFSLRYLFVVVTALGLAMMLVRVCQPAMALFVIAAIAIPLTFCLPELVRRPFLYGGLCGVFAGLLLSRLILTLVFIQHPRDRIERVPDAGQPTVPAVQRQAEEMANPYIVTLGFVLGAAVGPIVMNREEFGKG